jgi:LmbE family N-acetylglucosaminyl deacetylase
MKRYIVVSSRARVLPGKGLAGRTILALFAHPDDESLACGGTLARISDAGARVVLYCASRGEAGSTADPALVPDGDLGRVRTRELQDAAATLGIGELLIGDHPDGSLRWTPTMRLRQDIALTVQRHRPDAVITFDEDGLYWHPDHVGMHEHTDAAVSALGSNAPALYYVTIPHGVISAIVEAVRTRRGAPPEIPQPFPSMCGTGRRESSRRSGAIAHKSVPTTHSRGSAMMTPDSGLGASIFVGRVSVRMAISCWNRSERESSTHETNHARDSSMPVLRREAGAGHLPIQPLRQRRDP